MGGAMKYFLEKLLVHETFKKFKKNFEKFVKPSAPPPPTYLMYTP